MTSTTPEQAAARARRIVNALSDPRLTTGHVPLVLFSTPIHALDHIIHALDSLLLREDVTDESERFRLYAYADNRAKCAEALIREMPASARRSLLSRQCAHVLRLLLSIEKGAR